MRKLNYHEVVLKIEGWLESYLRNAGLKGYIIGLSGGIDSAVVASLCVGAIGKENVVGLGLPCESFSKDLEDAKNIADQLGIQFHIINLTDAYKELVNALPKQLSVNKMAMANIKPRLRMTMLYYYAQSLGYLVAGTGNRTEIAIGYFTKYGDGGVDLEPIGSLYKGEVRKIAEILNVPKSIRSKPPSAGLWEGQTDEGEIGMMYDAIDEILYRIDMNEKLDDMDPDNVRKVKNLIKVADHKIKMPPTFKI